MINKFFMYVLTACCLFVNACSQEAKPPAAVVDETPSVPPTDMVTTETYPDREVLPAMSIAPAATTLQFKLELSDGHKWIDDAPTNVTASSDSTEIVAIPEHEGGPDKFDVAIPLEISGEGAATLLFDITGYFCATGNEQLCFRKQAKLAMPITVTVAGETQPARTYILPPGQPPE